MYAKGVLLIALYVRRVLGASASRPVAERVVAAPAASS